MFERGKIAEVVLSIIRRLNQEEGMFIASDFFLSRGRKVKVIVVVEEVKRNEKLKLVKKN